MSRLIESLEDRVLFSVTPAQLQADAKALVTATAASNTAFNAVRSAEFGLINAVAKNVEHKGGLIGNVVGSALVGAFSGAGKTGYVHIKSSQKVLTSAAKSTANRSVAKGKALLKDASNSTVASDVQDLITQLNATLPADLSSLQTVLQDAGTLIENAFTAIVAALPGISSAIDSVAQTVLQKSQDFDTALAAIPTAAAQLAADLSSLTATQGAAALAHANLGPVPSR
jgi:hypothetical protein